MEEEVDRDAVRQAASLMGRVRTPQKSQAARENGRLGGRPPGTPQSEETKQKIRQARLTQEAEKKAAAPPVEEEEKRHVGRPRTRPLETGPTRGRGRPRNKPEETS